MKDHALTQAILLVLIVSAGIILEKWIVLALPDGVATNPLKKLVNYI